MRYIHHILFQQIDSLCIQGCCVALIKQTMLSFFLKRVYGLHLSEMCFTSQAYDKRNNMYIIALNTKKDTLVPYSSFTQAVQALKQSHCYFTLRINLKIRELSLLQVLGLSLWGRGQNVLGWPEAGGLIFFQGAKVYSGVKEGANFFFQEGGQFLCLWHNS